MMYIIYKIHDNFKHKLHLKHCYNIVFNWSTRTCFKQKKYTNNAYVYRVNVISNKL